MNLPDSNKHCDTDTDTLCIMKVEKGDNKARYRCHVKNKIGEESSKDAVLTISKLVTSVINICWRKISLVTKFIV